MTPIVSDAYKEKRKIDILESAFICFARKGFELATINDIVEQSGLSKGAIYNYYNSKDEIYLELMSYKTEETFNLMNLEIASRDKAIDKLDYLFKIYLQQDPFLEGSKANNLVHLEFRIHAARNKELVELFRLRKHKYFLSQVEDVLYKGQVSGEIKKSIAPDLYADIFWSIIDGTVTQTLVYEDYPFYDALNELKQMYINQIRP